MSLSIELWVMGYITLVLLILLFNWGFAAVSARDSRAEEDLERKRSRRLRVL